MSHFKLRVHEDLWVFVDRQEDGSHLVRVLDARSRPVTDERERTRGLIAALYEESKRRTALWEALPEEARRAIREGRTA
jgi:hypothetical protein